jgi:non-lysosomal glucosylceramidase
MPNSNQSPTWPILKSYSPRHLENITLPTGGIGTGTISLGGRGNLLDFEVQNKPAKGFTPIGFHPGSAQRLGPMLIVRAQSPNQAPVARLLEGPLPPSARQGPFGSPAINHGLPRFQSAKFHAAYPLAQVELFEKNLPCDARLEVFNPLIPGDAPASSLPVMAIRVVITNRTSKPLSVTTAASLPNFIGVDPAHSVRAFAGIPTPVGGKDNINTFFSQPNLQGLQLTAPTLDIASPQFGTLALATTAKTGVTHRIDWTSGGWSEGILDFWEDLLADGSLDPRPMAGHDRPHASLAVRANLKPKQSHAFTFLITWHFPNRLNWSSAFTIGNLYTTLYKDAWDAALKIAPELPSLEKRTVSFVKSLVESNLPRAAVEAALFNISTLRSQTCFQTPDGHFFGWEGSGIHAGSCAGSCTHVWNYEQTLSALFPTLARSMRTIEFNHSTRADGMMCFRSEFPIDKLPNFQVAAADGQMGTLVRLYRDWQLSGDDAFLKSLWPNAKKALEFCWAKGGWDADQDGVMEGCQHNTMDVEYFGPNPQMTGWYLAALRACEEMASHLGDTAFADKCRALFNSGSAWMDIHLFNGEYFEHHVTPIADKSAIHGALAAGMGSASTTNPDFQLASGCLVDQLVGQAAAHAAGLGYLHHPSKIKKTLQSILKYNTVHGFDQRFNNMRSYAMGSERALVMASYPRGNRPPKPFPYFAEVMTGFEYTAALGMLYENLEKPALRIISDIRNRYDGLSRNPFDEAECGHHYARAMIAWGAITALTGFQYSAVSESLTFKAKPGKHSWFFSAGNAWGTFTQHTTKSSSQITLKLLEGNLTLKSLTLAGLATHTFANSKALIPSQPLNLTLKLKPSQRS